MKSYKYLFSRAFAAAPGRLHCAAHSHHLWPDAAYDGHLAACHDAIALADHKWERILGEVLPEARSNVADELRLATSDSIAFAPNTHELLGRIFSARGGDRPIEVLTSDGEFHSFQRQSARWVETGRIRLRTIACEPFESFADRFLSAVSTQEPDIVFLSHVMFKTGLRFDHVAELARLARPDGVWIVLDIYHSFMAMPCDFRAVSDRVFLLGGGYKYAMAGEGVCFLHAPEGFALRPEDTGWFAAFDAIETKQGAVSYASDGGRFLGATFDPTGLYRFNAVRKMLAAEDLNSEIIASRVLNLRDELASKIQAGRAGALREADLLRPNSAGWPARFLSLRHPSAIAWKGKLLEHEIVTDARDGILRIGLGLYHEAHDVERFCQSASSALRAQ